MDNMASYRPPVAAAALAVLSAAGVFACTRALGREQIDHAAAVEPEPEPEPEPAAANAGKKNDDDADELAEEARLAKKRAEIDAKPRPQTGMERVKAKVGEAKWAAMSAKQRKMAMLKELDSDSDDEEDEAPDDGRLWARAMGLSDDLRLYTGRQMLDVPRVDAREISPEEFVEKYVNRALPVVLTHAMESWPAFKDAEKKWTIENFAKRFGDTDVIIDTAGKKEIKPIKDYLASFPECSAQMKAAADKNEKAPPMPYLRTWYFADQLPELVSEFETPSQFADDAFRRLPDDMVPPFQWLFFGPKGTESKLHVDVWETDAWLGNLGEPSTALPSAPPTFCCCF